MRRVKRQHGNVREEKQARDKEQEHKRADNGHDAAEMAEDERSALRGIEEDGMTRHEFNLESFGSPDEAPVADSGPPFGARSIAWAA